MERIALLSVFYKDRIVEYARALVALGWKIISSGGTATALRAAGIPVEDISAITKYPVMLGHRVVTLHPTIHGGILARRIPEDEVDLVRHGIRRISHVCVDPYPVEKCALDPFSTILEVLDMVDIGGPTMIRGAAKNFPHGISVVCDPADRQLVLDELKVYGRVREPARTKLAFKVFAMMARYNGVIAARMAQEYDFPFVHLSETNGWEVRYGTNPHQRAFAFVDDAGPLSDHKIVFEGKGLSYNNWDELTYAVELISRFAAEIPTGVIYKHLSPCGVATGRDIAEAFCGAWNGDPVSAFGSTVAVNGTVDEETAELMDEFFEVLVCRSIEKKALQLLRKRWRNLRIITTNAVAGPDQEKGFEIKKRMGVTLVQERDTFVPDASNFIQAGNKKATPRQIEQMIFAAKCCIGLCSNATAIIRHNQMVGYGKGASSRVDTCQMAVDMAKKHEHSLHQAVAVTDGFFPFADGLEKLAKAGVKVIACPNAPTAGQRSGEVIASANKLGVAFYHLDHRLFRH